MPFSIVSSRQKRLLQASYEIAEFVHNLCVSIAREEFASHDIWFLNVQARSLIERNNEQNCPHYSLFAYYIQELFKIVPEELRVDLEWDGPSGDYSRATKPKKEP